MKRYLLFKGAFYYPMGGWDDFAGDFGTLEEAVAAAQPVADDWAHVIDKETGERTEVD